MTRKTCKYPNCDRDTRDETGHAGRFCSDEHEVKYDHLKADADEARYEDRQEAHHDQHPGNAGKFL